VCGGIPTTVRHQQLPRSLYHRQPPTSSITSVCPAASSTQSQQSAVKQTTHNSLHHQQPAISSIMTDYPAASTTATHSQQPAASQSTTLQPSTSPSSAAAQPTHAPTAAQQDYPAQPTTITPGTTRQTTEDLALAPGALAHIPELECTPFTLSTGQPIASRVHEAADMGPPISVPTSRGGCGGSGLLSQASRKAGLSRMPGCFGNRC
jgi:hypothetical protein